jgi:hypothetical protein
MSAEDEIELVEVKLTDADLLRQARETLHAAMQGGSRTGSMDTSAALAVWQTMREAEEREKLRGVER